MAASLLKTLQKIVLKSFLGGATNPRQLQHEADIHRLFLLTTFHRQQQQQQRRLGRDSLNGDSSPIHSSFSSEGSAGTGSSRGASSAAQVPPSAAEGSVLQAAAALDFEQMREAVQDNVHRQVVSHLRVIRSILEPSAEAASDAETGFGRLEEGRGEVSDWRPSSAAAGLFSPLGPIHHLSQEGLAPKLSHSQVSDCFFQKASFTLHLRPSEISHPSAGQGLFLRGSAPMGSVVALYPGVIFSPKVHRYMEGFPRIDRDNPYLISRFEGHIIDGKPWGKGGDERGQWSGLREEDSRWYEEGEEVKVGGGRGGYETPEAKERRGVRELQSINARLMEVIASRSRREEELLEGKRTAAAEATQEIIERRNPIALAHFANHPDKGSKPNVLLCPYDFSLKLRRARGLSLGEEAFLRPYMPNVAFCLGEERDEDEEMEGRILSSLVLVAARDLEDEELLLNYRLSGLADRPDWYHPVNEEEDRRRWA